MTLCPRGLVHPRATPRRGFARAATGSSPETTDTLAARRASGRALESRPRSPRPTWPAVSTRNVPAAADSPRGGGFTLRRALCSGPTRRERRHCPTTLVLGGRVIPHLWTRHVFIKFVITPPPKTTCYFVPCCGGVSHTLVACGNPGVNPDAFKEIGQLIGKCRRFALSN